jgi:hypothetical protein
VISVLQIALICVSVLEGQQVIAILQIVLIYVNVLEGTTGDFSLTDCSDLCKCA